MSNTEGLIAMTASLAYLWRLANDATAPETDEEAELLEHLAVAFDGISQAIQAHGGSAAAGAAAEELAVKCQRLVTEWQGGGS